MTEGPETTYLSGYIRKYFKGKILRRIQIHNGRYKHHGSPPGFKQFTSQLPLNLQNVYKKGKILCFSFENGWFLLAKLGMVGWFSKPDDEPIFMSDPNLVFTFENANLGFFDFRNFGTLTFTQDVAWIESEFNRLAPDILADTPVPSKLVQRSMSMQLTPKQQKQTLDTALMDQTFLISGIGNIIKCELLYRAKLSPLRTIDSLKRDEWDVLFKSARVISRKVLQNLEKRGLDLDAYFTMHAIYQKKEDPLGNPVHIYKSKDGRTTYWVPFVQN